MRIINVGVYSYETAKAPDELCSGGVGPCIALGAIYEEKGYMLHVVPVGTDISNYIDPFFTDLKNDVRSKKKLKIYLIGGEIGIIEDSQDEMKAGRKYFLDKIVENGFKECIKEVKWCPSQYYQELRLVLSKDIAIIKEFDIREETQLYEY